MTSEDVSIVGFGSIARLELTPNSDLDWTVLIDGQAQPSHYSILGSVAKGVAELGFKPPGREGMFGVLSSSFDQIHFIGGADDTNENLTKRLLLILEAHPIGRDDAFVRTLKGVLHRYVSEDFGWVTWNSRSNVPRFLLNDIARYWRTLAVDFAYKRHARQGAGWALRTIKLRMSRKLTFAAGILMCFACAVDEELSRVDPSNDRELAVAKMVTFLQAYARSSSLDTVSSFLEPFPSLHKDAAELFAAYNSFLAVVADPLNREHLESLTADAIRNDALFETAHETSRRFQAALTSIFFSEDLGELTQHYGVF